VKCKNVNKQELKQIKNEKSEIQNWNEKHVTKPMVSNFHLQFTRDWNLKSLLLKKTQPIDLYILRKTTIDKK